MRFHFSNVPEVPARPTAAEDWKSVPALGARRVQVYGLLAGCAAMLLVAILLGEAFRATSIWAAFLILILAIPFHELVHALATPAWGLSDRTVIGLQRGKGLLLPYMYYEGSQPLWRMLFAGLAPTLVLTILPVLVLLFTPLDGSRAPNLGFLAFFNAAISGGDLVILFWIATHLPMRATVQQDGWGLLWKDE